MNESQIHKGIVQWLNVALPDGSVVHHSPNEGRHRIQYRVHQKQMGMFAGWPDLELFIPRGAGESSLNGNLYSWRSRQPKAV